MISVGEGWLFLGALRSCLILAASSWARAVFEVVHGQIGWWAAGGCLFGPLTAEGRRRRLRTSVSLGALARTCHARPRLPGALCISRISLLRYACTLCYFRPDNHLVLSRGLAGHHVIMRCRYPLKTRRALYRSSHAKSPIQIVNAWTTQKHAVTITLRRHGFLDAC